MGRRKTACQICSAVKTSCSQGRPCTRCERLCLPCNYEDDQASSLRPQYGEVERVPRSGHTWKRSKGGCTSCRRRRKKCDGEQPKCGDCERLNLTCVLRDISKTSPASPRSRSERSGGVSDNDAAELAQQEDTSSDQHDVAQRTVNIADVFEGGLSLHFSDWIALIEDENRGGSSKPADLAHSAALVDLPVPSKDDEAGLATFLPPTALNNLTGVTPGALKKWTFGQRHLLNHFLQSVSRALVLVQDEDNPFLRVVVPMTLENTMVRHAMLSLSACHLSKVYPVFGQDLLLHRSLALQLLKTDLVDRNSMKWAFVTTLLLCLSEICEGNSRKWFLHLHGARALLANVDSGTAERDGLQSMIELYDYLCCVASATSASVPIREVGMPSSPSDIHPLFGLSRSLYQYLPAITTVASQLINGTAKCTDEHIRAQAETIELQLQSWVPPHGTSSGRHFAEARSAAFATQWALILHLNRTTRLLKNDDFQIAKAANNILSALSLIRPGSEIEAHILFPLFMAGVGSTTKPNRLTVEYRLSIMETTIGFGNIYTAHRLLDEIWRWANDGIIVNWEDLMRTKYPRLVLF